MNDFRVKVAALIASVQVVLFDAKLRRWLEENDPQALKQMLEAVVAFSGDDELLNAARNPLRVAARNPLRVIETPDRVREYTCANCVRSIIQRTDQEIADNPNCYGIHSLTHHATPLRERDSDGI